MKELDLGELVRPKHVVFSDERERAPFHAPAGAAASVTLDADDQSWGEFLTLAEVALLRAWCDRLLSEEMAAE